VVVGGGGEDVEAPAEEVDTLGAVGGEGACHYEADTLEGGYQAGWILAGL
jgi:hypothetical protein